MNPTDSFRKIVSRYGIALEFDESDTNENVWPGYKELLAYFNAMLRARGLTTSKVYCGWVASNKFNAFATKSQEYEFIAVFTGAAEQIYRYFHAFLSDPTVLPNLSLVESERIDIGATKALLEDPDGPGPALPKDSLRHAVALRLGWSAIMFLFAHEMAHLHLCHLDLIAENKRTATYLEIPAAPLSEETSRLRQYLELNADENATRASISNLRHFFGLEGFHTLGLSLEDTWSMSVAMLFFIMEKLSPDHSSNLPSHPPAMMRLVNVMTLTAHDWFSQYLGQDAVSRGIQEVSRWWRKMGFQLQRIEGRAAGEQLNMMQSQFAATYGVRLQELSDIRAKRLSNP